MPLRRSKSRLICDGVSLRQLSYLLIRKNNSKQRKRGAVHKQWLSSRRRTPAQLLLLHEQANRLQAVTLTTSSRFEPSSAVN
jgi:hypothetical protein